MNALSYHIPVNIHWPCYTGHLSQFIREVHPLKDMKTRRESNIELLRVFAMVMIIVYHIYCHCVDGQLNDGIYTAFNNTGFYKKLFILDAIAPFGKIGNAIFIMISGYFMILKGNQIDLGKTAKKLLLQLGFAAVLLTVIPPVVLMSTDGIKISLLNINVFNSMSWFAGYYFTVIVFAGIFFNKYLNELDKPQYVRLLFVLFAITQFSWTYSLLESLAKGLSTFITGVFLYGLGGFIQKYNPFEKIRGYIWVLAIIAAFALIFISNYNIYLQDLQNYNGTDLFERNILRYHDSYFIPLLISASLFELFRRVRIPQSRVINFMGGATFMVYLLHDNGFAYSIWATQDWIDLLYSNPCLYMFKHLAWAMAVFGIGMIGYSVYLFIGWLAPRCMRFAIKS